MKVTGAMQEIAGSGMRNGLWYQQPGHTSLQRLGALGQGWGAGMGESAGGCIAPL